MIRFVSCPQMLVFFDVFLIFYPSNFRFNQFSFTSNPLSQIVTSNPRLQPDTHFAVDMFPYKKTELFRSPASNPSLRKSPEICRFQALDFSSWTSTLPSQRDESSGRCRRRGYLRGDNQARRQAWRYRGRGSSDRKRCR